MAGPDHLRRLQDGVDTWNAWRAANPGITPDLSGVPVNGSLHGYNLAKANLHSTDLSGALLDDATILAGARDDETTRWPSQFTVAGRGIGHDRGVTETIRLDIATTATTRPPELQNSANAKLEERDPSIEAAVDAISPRLPWSSNSASMPDPDVVPATVVTTSPAPPLPPSVSATRGIASSTNGTDQPAATPDLDPLTSIGDAVREEYGNAYDRYTNAELAVIQPGTAGSSLRQRVIDVDRLVRSASGGLLADDLIGRLVVELSNRPDLDPATERGRAPIAVAVNETLAQYAATQDSNERIASSLRHVPAENDVTVEATDTPTPAPIASEERGEVRNFDGLSIGGQPSDENMSEAAAQLFASIEGVPPRTPVTVRFTGRAPLTDAGDLERLSRELEPLLTSAESRLATPNLDEATGRHIERWRDTARHELYEVDTPDAVVLNRAIAQLGDVLAPTGEVLTQFDNQLAAGGVPQPLADAIASDIARAAELAVATGDQNDIDAADTANQLAAVVDDLSNDLTAAGVEPGPNLGDRIRSLLKRSVNGLIAVGDVGGGLTTVYLIVKAVLALFSVHLP